MVLFLGDVQKDLGIVVGVTENARRAIQEFLQGPGRETGMDGTYLPDLVIHPFIQCPLPEDLGREVWPFGDDVKASRLLDQVWKVVWREVRVTPKRHQDRLVGALRQMNQGIDGGVRVPGDVPFGGKIGSILLGHGGQDGPRGLGVLRQKLKVFRGFCDPVHLGQMLRSQALTVMVDGTPGRRVITPDFDGLFGGDGAVPGHETRKGGIAVRAVHDDLEVAGRNPTLAQDNAEVIRVTRPQDLVEDVVWELGGSKCRIPDVVELTVCRGFPDLVRDIGPAQDGPRLALTSVNRVLEEVQHRGFRKVRSLGRRDTDGFGALSQVLVQEVRGEAGIVDQCRGILGWLTLVPVLHGLGTQGPEDGFRGPGVVGQGVRNKVLVARTVPDGL